MSLVTISPGRILRLTCPCDLASVRDVAREIRSYLEREGLNAFEVNGWELICTEAGNNAVEYASGAAAAIPVEFTLETTSTTVELRVIDHTPGFELPDQSVLPDPFDEGGRGLYLMRTLSDSLKYLRGPDENCLVVRRQRSADGPGESTADITAEHAMLQATLHTMTEEIATSYEILSAIFRFTEELNQGVGDTGFIERWLCELAQITGADWHILRLVDATGRCLAVSHTSHPTANLDPIHLDTLSTSCSVEVKAVTGHQDVWFDAQEPPSARDPLRCLGPELAGFAHPLLVAGELVGILTVGRHSRTHSFNAGQVNIIHTLTDFLAIQIRNAQFQAEKLRAQLIERDYEVAARIQQQLLPKIHPCRGRWTTLGLCESAQRVGGDFYDIIEVGRSGLLLAVADVMGKGLPAALFATVFRTLLHAKPDLARVPSAFIEWLNQNLVAELAGLEMIITAQLAYVNFDTRELRVAGAGHPPLLIAAADGTFQEVLSSGPPLGIDDAQAFDEDRRFLPEGARILLYTDGITEATDEAGVPIGTDPVIEILKESARLNLNAQETVDRFAALPRGTTTTRAADDRTLLLLSEDTALMPEACAAPNSRTLCPAVS
ncbi:MAG: SpoIIE family protein phosphatase [Verrucomicrobiales bacterium]|nr:SpoIIE family protein phosphatase [Verrucomicrobiales bacterium]